MDEDPAEGFDTEENYYAFLNVPKTVSFFFLNVPMSENVEFHLERKRIH